MTTRLTRRAALLAGVFACALAGCHNEDPQAEPEAATVAYLEMPEGEPVWSYEGILGIVAELPEANNPASAFKIHHEHIPTFVNPRSGELAMTSEGVPGMRAMVMEMPPAVGVDIAALGVGDKVRFDFAVWNEPRVAWRMTAVETIDPETEISFDDKP
ncbi:MAG: hypothetical protein RIB60_06295 [Phycisphaerales bacterium]